MADERSEPSRRPEHGRLRRVARVATRWPRLVVAVWLATVAGLSLIGVGIEEKLSTEPVFIEGSETKREYELVTREFGRDNGLFVLLRGPRAAIETQGRKLERRLDAMPRTTVISPWDRGGAIEGLRPSANELALLVSVGRLPDQGPPDLVAPLRRTVEATVSGPVEISIAGVPALIESFRTAAADATEAGERIAIPILLVVLLLVFRSVLAAVIPVVVGGAVVSSARGVLDLLTGFLTIDAFALAAMGMMGLALGVDYALLIVSRFREEMAKGDDVAVAVQDTVAATGRSVVPAGCGLLLAMLAASLLLPGQVVASVAIAVSVASVLSVISAIVVVPAILTLLGTRLDRWALPRRGGEQGGASRWAQRLSRRPALVLPVILLLVLASAWAFTLDSRVTTVELLPPGDSGRQEQEDVQEALGPGWVSPLEIVMQGRGEPVTTPDRLRALAEFQRQVEADPAVDSMAGLAEIERRSRRMQGLEGSLAAQQRGLGRLGAGIGRLRDGADSSADGLVQAAAGAGKLGSALGETEAGAGLLAAGSRRASAGSLRLTDGLGRASEGSGELARGTALTSAGAGRLSDALAKAAESSGEAVGTSRVLKSAMRTGDEGLARLHGPLLSTETQLEAARQALEEMTAGRDDPQYAAALAAVNAANRGLTGVDPASGERVDPGFEGVGAGIEEAESQFSLGSYLANRVRKGGRNGERGLRKLSHSSARLDRGLRRLATASEQVSAAIAALSRGGQELSPALVRLSRGADALAGGLGQVQNGADGLATGLDDGARKSHLLTDSLGRIGAGIERQQDNSAASALDDAPGLFRSGYFYLAGLDGTDPDRRGKAGFLINLDGGGSAARMLVIPGVDSTSDEATELTARVRADAAELARETGTEVAVGGETTNAADADAWFRDRAPWARLGLCLVTLLVLVPVVRSLTLPLIAALLNLLTVSATFGLLSLLFNDSLLGGPGYVDTAVIPATIMVIFGLAIDYEVFLFARMREEYERTGSHRAAIENGLSGTAHVITGAAFIMIVVFLVFAVSSFATMRNFGVAQAIAVFIDAFLIRLFVLPVLMRAMGEWSWWCPAWLDRLLPGGRPLVAGGEAR